MRTNRINGVKSFAVFLSCLAAAALLAKVALAAGDVPTIDQVYQAARSGHLVQAEEMMHQVLRAYPKSARAHYVMAEILAAEGRFVEARTHLEEAERLKPGLPFASRQSVAELQRKIAAGANLPYRNVAHTTAVSFHWWWLLLAAVLVWVIFRALSASRQTPVAYSSGSGSTGGGATGPAPGVPPVASGGGGGGGLWNSILAGLGFGAGVAAGEYAVDRLLGGGAGRGAEAAEPPVQPPATDSDDLGGEDFGVQSGDASTGGWEDQADQQSAGWDDDEFAGDAGDGSGGWDDSSDDGGDIDV